MTLRRLVARRERAANRHNWPIKESAGKIPPDWTGWPDAKDFAVVLTHDIETADGVAQVKQLAELESQFGFRSSFNFIPCGAYSVPSELRTWLVDHGFEVGVHDLQHDGRLFQSKRGFAQKAIQINRYLHNWNCAGFRSGFMLRNLEWLHQLDIKYDASTFDTDPFELQSDGADTIFPHWIASNDTHTDRPGGATGDTGAINIDRQANTLDRSVRRTGYVELPYTLPQDSTLFLVLNETTSDIWLRKTDWVVRKGGMVLVNVHPDYIDFSGEANGGRRYPASRYADLLRYLLRKYPGQYWQPLPKDLAAWFTSNRLRAPAAKPYEVAISSLDKFPELRRKRAAVLLYSEYPADPRPRRAAEAMVEAGMEVDLLCVAGENDELPSEVHGGVYVTRVPIRRSRDSKFSYLAKYARFIAASFWFLTRRGLRRKYDIIHVHNMPDVLVFSSLLSKIFGAKVILDLHDPMPEVMMTIYGLEENRPSVRSLKKMEKWSIRLADNVITVNEACRRLFSARSCANDKIHVIMNSPDERVFNQVRAKEPLPGQRQFVVMYHGSIVERHGLDLAVSAFAEFARATPNAELRIYGNHTRFLDTVMESVKASAISHQIKYLGPRTLEGIVEAIRECDVGIVPNRRSIFTELNTPTRIFEYLSQRKPVIAPRAPGILDYFGASDLIYFELGNVAELAGTLSFAYNQPKAVCDIVERGRAVYQKHLWSEEKHRFIDVIANTLGISAALANGSRPGHLALAPSTK